jgi:hypothetical protein
MEEMVAALLVQILNTGIRPEPPGAPTVVRVSCGDRGDEILFETTLGAVVGKLRTVGEMLFIRFPNYELSIPLATVLKRVS